MDDRGAPLEPGGIGAPAPANPDPEPMPPLEWTVNDWRGSPRKSLLAIASVIAVALALFGAGLAPLNAAVLAIVASVALAPAFLPLRCRVDEAGVALKRLLVWERRDWRRIRRARLDPVGLFVSPYSSKHYLDAYHGLRLPVPSDPARREPTVVELRRRLAEHGL